MRGLVHSKLPRTFVIGDIHGAYAALLQCMNRAKFDYFSDKLICLGDVCDRRNRVKECIEELLKVKNLILILGNHDQWALEWMENKNDPGVWLLQGGSDTVESYRKGIPEKHIEFLKSADYFHIEKNCLYVHGGIDYRQTIKIQNPQNFLWDRSLVNTALEMNKHDIKLTEFNEVYVGHTPTINFFRKNSKSYSEEEGESRPDLKNGQKNRNNDKPIRLCNVWLMDTGAGWPGGRLSMMNIDTKEVFQSDILS